MTNLGQNVQIQEAVEAALKPRSRRAASGQKNLEPSGVARLQDGSEVDFRIEDNRGGGDCLFLAAGTTRALFLDMILRDRERYEEWFVQAMAAGRIRCT